MDWKAALVDNWPYKVAALALAVLLWFNVSANQDRREQFVTTRLELDIPGEEWVAVDVPAEVRTSFRGRLGDLLALPGNPVLRRTIENVSDSIVTVPLDVSMVEYDRRLNVQPVSVRPSQVEVRFQPLVEKPVPVTIDVSAAAAEGFTVVGSPIVEPESVTVRGARGEVEAISHVEAEPIDVEGLKGSTTRQLAVRVPPDLETLSVQPEQVLVTLRVDSLAVRRLRIGLRPVGPGAPGVVLSPGEVEVVLRGSASAIRELTVREMAASVRVDAVPEREARLPVQVSLPDGVSATAEVSPETVTVAPAGPGPASPDTAGGR